MKFCTACGHELGIGRFCINCGEPVAGSESPKHAADPEPLLDARTDTAERPAIPPTPVEAPTQAAPTVAPPTPGISPVPPRPAAPPTTDYSSGRFPLYADEAAPRSAKHAAVPASAGAGAGASAPVTPRADPFAVPPEDLSEEEPAHARPWAVFVVVGAVLFLVVALGVWLLGFGGGDPTPDNEASDGDSLSLPATESGSASSPGSGSKVTAPDNPQQLAGTARASAPVTAPPNQDVSGDKVTYVAANMLDGDPATAWRMPGDGTGQVLTFTLAKSSVLTKVGLINGYAKVDRAGGGPPVDWYHRNRKVDRVEWIFDDGTRVKQSLDRTLRMQTLSIPPVQTKTINLKLVEVSAPAARNGRNYTPVSEVSLVGG